jgi:hypothetical protein
VTDTLERAGTQVRYDTPLPGVECPGRWHRTASAARRHGCICPPAVAAYEVQLARKRVGNDGPGRGARAEWMAELNRRTALRRHGNPREQMAAGLDPREPWRGPSCRVDRLTVDFLMAGYRFAGSPPTMREFQIATWQLRAAGMNRDEISTRLGVVGRTVERYRSARREQRAERTRRRHADALWRAWHKHGQRW